MAHAITAGLRTPLYWLGRMLGPRDRVDVRPMAEGMKLCTVCHLHPAPESTDYRCMECWLECNAAP